MKTLVCLLEEPSAEEMLRAVLPRILPQGVEARFIVFEGKQDLEKQIERRLRYWKKPDSVFLVMRDQDAGDCHAIKNGLRGKVKKAGKEDLTVIRIACHELESFYLGDLRAVEQGLEVRNLSKHQDKQKYRHPDKLANAAQELKSLTKVYQKVSGSRAIAPFLDVEGQNKSNSFNVLLNGINSIVQD